MMHAGKITKVDIVIEIGDKIDMVIKVTEVGKKWFICATTFS